MSDDDENDEDYTGLRLNSTVHTGYKITTLTLDVKLVIKSLLPTLKWLATQVFLMSCSIALSQGSQDCLNFLFRLIFSINRDPLHPSSGACLFPFSHVFMDVFSLRRLKLSIFGDAAEIQSAE